MKANKPARWQWHYKRLVQLLEESRAAQRDHLRDAAAIEPPLRRSMLESAAEEFDRDLLLGEVTSGQTLIYEIKQALRRIQQGTYGTCELTGKPIPKARLRAIPWTRFCQAAEINLERNGIFAAPHIGELRSVCR